MYRCMPLQGFGIGVSNKILGKIWELIMTNPIELLRITLGGNSLQSRDEWNDSLTALLSHRSIRSYLSDPLPGNSGVVNCSRPICIYFL